MMKVALSVVLVIGLFCGSGAQTVDKLQCRRCNGATTLDECTTSVTCGDSEICYIDQVVTESLSVVFNGGCRAKDVCIKGTGPVGKRDATGFIACTECCSKLTNHSAEFSAECNTKLCGIKASNASISQCYSCSSEHGGSAVTDPQDCTNLITCQSDEVCGTETFRLIGHDLLEFKCLRRDRCSILTKLAIAHYKECKTNPRPNCWQGKRETSGQKICTACCGDSLCNSEDCFKLIEKLSNLNDAGALNMTTLMVKPSTGR